MKNQIWIACKATLFMTILTGVIYPLSITGIAQALFSYEANGSLINQGNKIVGSSLIGQKFDSAAYFWSRPSACDYQTLPSGASNLSLTSNRLNELYKQRKVCFIQNNQLSPGTEVPSDMLFASASGLDPHISAEAARLQTKRICKTRNFNATQTQKLLDLVENCVEYRQCFFLGEPRVNVLVLNVKLDQLR
jgi:K+-transporting ATPase ATPase C chain